MRALFHIFPLSSLFLSRTLLFRANTVQNCLSTKNSTSPVLDIALLSETLSLLLPLFLSPSSFSYPFPSLSLSSSHFSFLFCFSFPLPTPPLPLSPLPLNLTLLSYSFPITSFPFSFPFPFLFRFFHLSFVTDDVTWPQKVKLVTHYLWGAISP